VYRIVLADDHSVVREGVARLIERAPDMALVGEAANGPEAVALVLATDADACVLDLGMPGGGLTLVEQLRSLKPALRILVLSQQPERPFALRALEAGANGYVHKSSRPGEVTEAVRRVASGLPYLSDEAQALAVERLARGAAAAGILHDTLSPREFDIFLRLAAGERVTEIAATLGISFKTVSTHRSNILDKLGLATNADLTLHAREHGLM
jgi:DNA-binding NarL/FixJ family response regulator